MIPVHTLYWLLDVIRIGVVSVYVPSSMYVYDVQSVMIEKCDITQHCLQLLAVRSDPTILYWTIPKCVVDLINTNVSLHSEYLYSRRILEVLVYPDLLLTTGDDVCYGSLAFQYLYSRRILEVLVYPDLLLTTGDDVCCGSLAFQCAVLIVKYTYIRTYVRMYV